MFNLIQLQKYLFDYHSDFEIIKHKNPIISITDAIQYFDIEKAVPTFVMQTEIGLIALIISSQRGKINEKQIKKLLGFSTFKFANKNEVKNITGYSTGTIPLIGHCLPCIFDNILFKHDYIFGGSGDKLHTLKITPIDVVRLNHVVKYLD